MNQKILIHLENTYFIESILFPGNYLSYFGSVLRFIPKRNDLSQHWIFSDGNLTNIDYKWKLEISNYDKFFFNGSSFLTMDRKMAFTASEDPKEEKKLELKEVRSVTTEGEKILLSSPSQFFRIISAKVLLSPPPQKSGPVEKNDLQKSNLSNLYYHHELTNPLKGQKYFIQIPFYDKKGFLSHDVQFGLSVKPMSLFFDEKQMWYFNNGTIMNSGTCQYLKYSPCSNSILLVSKKPEINPWMFDGQFLTIVELQHYLQIDGREPSTKYIRLIPSGNHNHDMAEINNKMNRISTNWSLFLDLHSSNNNNNIKKKKKKDLRNLYVTFEEEIMGIIKENPSLNLDVRDHIKHLRLVQDIVWKSLNEKQKSTVESYRTKSENKRRKRETKQIKKHVKSQESEEKKIIKKRIKEEKKKNKNIRNNNNNGDVDNNMISKEEKKRKGKELREWLVKNGVPKKKYWKRLRKRGVFGVEEVMKISEEKLEEIVDRTFEFRRLQKVIFSEERKDLEEEEEECDISNLDDDDDDDSDDSDEEEEEEEEGEGEESSEDDDEESEEEEEEEEKTSSGDEN